LKVDVSRPAAPLAIDYDRYASAEALLGWFNGRVRLHSDAGVEPASVMRKFLLGVSDAPIAHVKLTGADGDNAWGAVVRRGGPLVLEDRELPARVDDVRWTINARVAIDPRALETLVRRTMTAAAAPADVIWEDVECFSPSRPAPTHRYAQRCSTSAGASCCTAFYQRADVRRLLGDSFHPGGIRLTLRAAAELNLRRGDSVLDVACGNGESLRAIIARWPVRAVGLDASVAPLFDATIELRTGDAHAIPCESESVDAVLCECALSTFLDQPGALREMRRVLRAGGRLALTDMVLEGDVPESLRQWVHTGTCLERALSTADYVQALSDAGFVVIQQWDASPALLELLTRIKRNLVGWIAASASGAIPPGPTIDPATVRQTLRDARRAIGAGIIRYGVFIAERPPDTVNERAP
jgi:SAM-dependent methyltransferase